MNDMTDYLRSTEVVDYDNPDVLAKAKELANGLDDMRIGYKQYADILITNPAQETQRARQVADSVADIVV